MNYITTVDLQNRVKPDIWNVATVDQRNQAVDGVNDQVDGYLLQAGYDLPILQDNLAIRRNALHMAAWDLATIVGRVPEPADKSALYLNYMSATKWFERVANGEVSLANITDQNSGNDGDTIADASDSSPRLRSNDSRGWDE
jgi:phage gp36-like protein